MSHAVIALLCALLVLSIGTIALLASFFRYVKLRSIMVASDDAMREARSAHGRIDRIDQEMKGDQQRARELHAKQGVIAGWVKFIMHKDISDAIHQQARKDTDDPNKTDP